MTVPPADTQEALDAKGLESSTTAFSQEQLAKLAFAVFYSANLCAPQNIESVIKEIDTCGNDCEHVSGSHCQREERGDYCPFSLAEDLRQISAALFGPRDPSHYVPSVFGPERMTAFRATTRAPGEGDITKSCGCVFKDLDIECKNPDCEICRAPGEGEPVSWWVTHQQPGEPYKATRMKRVAEIWAEQGLEVTRLYAAPPALAAPSYAQPAPRADLVEALKRRLDYRMNEHLAEMKPDFDDSITGFNEAWKIVDNLFAEAAIAALSEAPREAEGWQPTHRHVKRGSLYAVVAKGRLQVDGDLDMEKVTIYRGADGQYWVRPDYEFNNGRFEVLSAAPKREG